MIYAEMTKNYIFRELKCRLSIEETAKLCFKNVRTVKNWDSGKEIPKECKRLMRLHANTVGEHSDEWKEFKLENGKLILPTGARLTPREILVGAALLEIQSDLEIKTTGAVMRTARALQRHLKK